MSDAVKEPSSSSTSSTSTTSVKIKTLPFNASGLLGGTAQPNFPDGDPGKVSVVQIGPLNTQSGTLIFAFRNNTKKAISHVDWTATARNNGSIVATGSSQGTTPAQVQPGEVGLSYIFFSNSEAIPAGTQYEFSVSTVHADTSFFNTAPLKVTEANVSGQAIVGSANNRTGAKVTGPYSVEIYCFNGDNLVSHFSSFAEQIGDVTDGGSVTFSANLYGESCPVFALGVSGYFD